MNILEIRRRREGKKFGRRADGTGVEFLGDATLGVSLGAVVAGAVAGVAVGVLGAPAGVAAALELAQLLLLLGLALVAFRRLAPERRFLRSNEMRTNDENRL